MVGLAGGRMAAIDQPHDDRDSDWSPVAMMPPGEPSAPIRYYGRLALGMTSPRLRRMRNTLLDRNPVAWLLRPTAERRQLIWAAAVIMGLAQATVLARSFDMLAALMTPVLLANIVLSPLFDFLLAWQAARLFADARRSGSLELLLVTPGFRRAALRGIRLSLQETFLKPVLFILGMRLLGGALALVFIDENSRRFAEQHSYFLFVLLGMLKEATGFLAE
jgi:hypothetical protein